MPQYVNYFVATLPERYQYKIEESIIEASIYAMRPFAKKTFRQIIDEAQRVAPKRFHGSFTDRVQYAEPTLIPFDLSSVQNAKYEIISKIYQVLLDLCAFNENGSSSKPSEYLYQLIYNREKTLKGINFEQPLLEIYYLFNVQDKKTQGILQKKVQTAVLQKCRTIIRERRPICDDVELFEEIIERIGNANDPKRRAAFEIVEEALIGIPRTYRNHVIERIVKDFPGETLDGLAKESAYAPESFTINFNELYRLLEDKEYRIRLDNIRNDIEKDAIRMEGKRESIINLNIDRIKYDFEKHMANVLVITKMNTEEILRKWTESSIYPSEIVNVEQDNNYLTDRLEGNFLVQNIEKNKAEIIDHGSNTVAYGKHNVDFISEIKWTADGFKFNPVNLLDRSFFWK